MLALHSGGCRDQRIRLERTGKSRVRAVRVEDKNSNAVKVIWVVQSSIKKYFHSLLTQITCLSIAVPSHRGAARDRHGRGAGCGGREERIDEGA
jgi:hypothetical protein